MSSCRYLCGVACVACRSTAFSSSLSPQNLVLGYYECRRVIPADIGPGSPSRDTANCLLSRFNRSVETWRRYGWLRMVFTRCASSELKFGALREVLMVVRERQRCTVCREKPGRAQQRSTVSGEYASDSAWAEGSSTVDEPGEC